ncbi:hypothetical protein G9A89_007921 [Geosiphon pyriformis]|nr:hypothetical protein G9A89_007921 [Geosiphon pyriformis]
MKLILLVSVKLNNRFATLECSLTSLTKCVDKLAKRLNTPKPMVFQLSPGCQPLVTPSSQNQEADIVISEDSGVATSETSNRGKNKLKQYSRTTPNTPTLPKTTAKHLQTPEQGTSSKLPLIITLFPASLAQAQTPNLPLNQFARPEDFTSLRSPTRQQKPLQTSFNLLDFLAENQSKHSETAANEKNNSEITEEESINKDIETSPQEWLDQVTKAGDGNGWNAARMLRTIPYFLKETAGKWFENLATPFNDWNAFKAAFLEQFTDNNTSITLRNHF